jgi:hypothetical protein
MDRIEWVDDPIQGVLEAQSLNNGDYLGWPLWDFGGLLGTLEMIVGFIG